ncbi:MAG: endolytic transglycosylase MltG, partial [Candidatus Binatia bacterium]
RELHAPVALAAPEAVVVIPPGESFRAVAARLRDAGVVGSPLLLGVWARYRGLDRSVHSGEYRFRGTLSPVQVLERLQEPGEHGRLVTIPEGLTAAQIAALLEEQGYGGRDVFRCAMEDLRLLQDFGLPASGIEGYLFPDTYAFEWTTEPPDIIRAMLARFRQEGAALAAQRSAAGLSEAEMVTLASVIEEETGNADERRLISGVFHNRLRLGMPLQSDPTVLYDRGDGRGPLTRAELTEPRPYNTYVHRGLPPGPIANPGRAALQAAIDPASTAALFFVSRNDGSHEFSETLEAHNRAVRQYQKHD